MSVENLIDELEDIIDTSWHLPMSGGRSIIDAGEIKRIIEDMRLQLPKEVVQARKIIEDRSKILENAHQEASSIMKISEEKIRNMVSKSEIVKNAQASAENIINEAKSQSKEMRASASKYADDVMKQLDQIVTENLSEIRKARQMLRSSPESKSE